jgi:hypothetical protein
MSQTDDVSELLQKELNNGFIYGPFCKPPFEHYRVSPLGVATGKYSQKKRLILDCLPLTARMLRVSMI